MKLVRLLCIPAVIAATAMGAVTAYAHVATVSNVAATCQGGTKFCLTMHADLEKSEGRDIIVKVVGHKGDADTSLHTFTVHLAPGQQDISKDKDGHNLCVDVTPGQFDSFKIMISKPEGSDLDLTVEGVDDHGVITIPGTKCEAPSPSPSASPSTSTGSNVSPTPTPAAQALAATGGFDYRFPLIGLPILVAGLALLLVTLARGRRSETK